MASYDTLLKPTSTVDHHDDEHKRMFIVASIGHSSEVMKSVNLNLGASASYKTVNNKVMGFNDKGDDFSNFYNAELS